MTVSEKVSYIKGLAEGLSLDESDKNSKILKAVIDVLDDIAAELNDTQDDLLDISDQVDAVDEDLAGLEDFVYDEDDDDEDYDDDQYYEVTCPNCGNEICLDEDDLNLDGITCPNCGTPLEFDFDGEDEPSAEAQEIDKD